MADNGLRVLIVSAEVAPFAKVGGLADVAAALPKALAKLGHDVRVVMPAYKMVEREPRYHIQNYLDELPVTINPDWHEQAFVRQTTIENDIPVYLIGGKRFFSKATDSQKVYDIEAGADPYLFFTAAIQALLAHTARQWKPDVIHCNDWHTGLLPVALQINQPNDRPATVFTIHNLAYQGDFDQAVLWRSGLPQNLFNIQNLEAYGRLNFLKGGLVFSDLCNTVSPTYAAEIQTPEYGCGLHGLLSGMAAEGRMRGILNGIDYDEFNPGVDPNIPAHYGPNDWAGKAKCKTALQQEAKLPVEPTIPLFGLVSRLSDQKGLDLIAAVSEKMLDLPAQFIVLGTGDKNYEAFFKALQKKRPKHTAAYIGFDAHLAQRIYAGADLFLMPSRFEPCGLGQMISLRYGTIPVVRRTGGLADTVTEYNPAVASGNGFVFETYEPNALWDALNRAVQMYNNPSVWHNLVRAALASDFSWRTSAKAYDRLYRDATAKRTALI